MNIQVLKTLKARKKIKKIGLILLAFFIVNDVSAASAVKGFIDSISKVGNDYYAKGWACQTGYATSIRVHLFAGGGAGSGTIFASGTANQASASGVANACNSTGSNHRFNILISASNIAKYGGKKLYIHGISSIGTANLSINRSGVHTIPTSTVKGSIGSITKSGNSYYAKGWACQTGYATSIKVHLYAGGGAGSGGTHFASGTANQSSEDAVGDECNSTGNKHRFSILISQNNLKQYQGQKLYIHGISSIGTTNLAISRSGIHTIPAVYPDTPSGLTASYVESSHSLSISWGAVNNTTEYQLSLIHISEPTRPY